VAVHAEKRPDSFEPGVVIAAAVVRVQWV
jgi:hypothetical protein